MPLLRHDFRRVYGCSYDEVPIDEAIDLIATLPDGSRYVSAVDPARSWPRWRHAIADLQDEEWAIVAALRGVPADKAPRVMRPADAARQMVALDKARKARKRIEETEWEEA